MMSIFANEQVKINNIPIEKIIKDSSLVYFPEMFDDPDYFEHVFINKDKYVYLQDCYLTGEHWRPYKLFGDSDKREFFFYNKGIFISDFRGINCPIPYPLDAIGYINYVGQDIKLDVSRKNIISGYTSLRKGLTLILLKFLKEQINNNQALLEMINIMIEYYQAIK